LKVVCWSADCHRQDKARNLACRHLEEYFETSVRTKQFKGRAKRHEYAGHTCESDFRTKAKTNDVPVARLIGFEAKEIAEGRATVTLSTGPQHANPMGTLHGGILCDIADAAMGMAFASTLAPKESFTTVELKINFFRPVWEAHLKAQGKVVRRGQSLGYVDARSPTNAAGSLLRQRRLALC